jgi:aspartokinase-like uncharacterized kinase
VAETDGTFVQLAAERVVIVVKVGGSLFDHPALGAGLRAYVASLTPAEVLLVPGGGPVADAVRELDRVHALGEEASHWLALRSLSVTADLLKELLAREDGRAEPGRSQDDRLRLLDPFAFALEDESRPGALPHSWSVTTDSIAARAAVVFRAGRLVLLKSVDVPPDTPWPEAAAKGWVDAHFPRVAAALDCPVEVMNFRQMLNFASGRV